MSAISLNSLIGSNASSPEGSASLSGFSPEDMSKTLDAWRRASAIKAQAEAIGIPYLVHFTDLANLPATLEKGLGPVAELAAAGMPFRANDRLRLDGHTDAVSLSIGHPNDKMFAKYRWQDAERRWAVLVLKPSILWTLPVAFNRHNAADKRVSSLSQDQRMTAAAFDGMFATTDDLPSREASNLLPYDLTDVQAELLVFATIPARLITGVVFDSAASEASHRSFLGERRSTVEPGSSGFFAARSYARKAGWTY